MDLEIRVAQTVHRSILFVITLLLVAPSDDTSIHQVPGLPERTYVWVYSCGDSCPQRNSES